MACGIFLDQGSNPCPLHWQEDSLPLSYQGSPQVSVILSVTRISSWDCTDAAGSWPWHQKVDRASHEPEWGEPHEKGDTSCYVPGNVPKKVRASQWGEQGAGKWKYPGPWLLGVLQRKPAPVGKKPKPKSNRCSQMETQLEGLDRILPSGGQTQEPAWKGFLKNPVPAFRRGWEGLPWWSTG